MDIDVLAKKLDDLESQISSLKKIVSQQTSSINDSKEKSDFSDQKLREQNAEMTRIKNQISGIGQFDAVITKLRIDVNKLIGESEKRIALNAKMQEKMRDDEVKNIYQTLDTMKKELGNDFDQKNRKFLEEDARLVQRIKDIQSQVEERLINNDEIKGMYGLLEQEVKQNKKFIDNLNSEFDSYKKRMDETRAKMDTLISDIRQNENRMTEIIAMESERRSTFMNFMEQQAVLDKDREATWTEWKKQFETSINSIYQLIPEVKNQQMALNKTKTEFEEIAPKFERRANELTEMYRIMDEKFRKEWSTYRTDLEKRWTNVSLTLDDRQEGFIGQLEKIRERMQSVEDETHDIQEALLLMSREIQKGMHGIMNMVNGWMEAFSVIKPND